MPQGEVKAYESCDILDGEPCLPCQQSIKLDAQIVAAKGPALNNLLILKRNLRTEINRHHDPITRRLPPELTSRVFEIYNEENEIYGEENEEIYSEENEACGDWKTPPYCPFSALVLGAVCQTWRRIAWSSPSLWTRVHIYFRDGMNESYVDEVEKWLQRSGRLPLSMLIEFSSSNIVSARFRRLISIINQHSNHWQNLYITCCPDQLGLICGDSRGAPILHNLSIAGSGFGPPANYIFNPTMDAMKPRPSRVQLTDIHFKSVGIHWSDITHIALFARCIHLDECIELLRQAPQLINCHIDGICTPISADWKASVSAYQLIVPHGLQNLFLENYQGKDIGMFFQSFTFPNLSYLYLNDINDDDISLWNSIISLTNRSPMCLTSLKIHDIVCDFETLNQILQNLSCLVDLVIVPSGTNFQTHQLLSALANSFFLDTSGHYQTLFLPKLQSIYCAHCNYAPQDSSFWKSISQLSGPWKDGIPTTGIRPLRSVSIDSIDEHWSGPLSSESKICTDRNILLHLIELSRTGIRLNLRHYNVDLLEISKRHHGIME